MSRKLLEHPIVPILFGALITWDTSGNIVVKSYAYLLLYCWFSWDVWASLINRENSWWRRNRRIIFCFISGIAAVVMMLGMHWLLESKLQELQDDVSRNLIAAVQMPAAGDVMDTYFILTNGGKTAINHQDYCGIHLIVGENKAAVSGLSIVVATTSKSLGVGESRSVQCLDIFGFNIQGVSIACADVEFWTEYALDTDAARHNRKYFRFIGYKVKNQFVFVPEQPSLAGHSSLADDHRYCGKFLMQYPPR